MTQQVEVSPERGGKERARRRAEALRAEIEHHDHRYYVLDAPVIADAEYDALVAELVAIERRYPELVTADSPTQRVGAAPQAGFAVVRHETPMLSLEARYAEKDFRRFWQTCQRAAEGANEGAAEGANEGTAEGANEGAVLSSPPSKASAGSWPSRSQDGSPGATIAASSSGCGIGASIHGARHAAAVRFRARRSSSPVHWKR